MQGTKPTQPWRCKACKAEGEVAGSLRSRSDILLNKIVAAHAQQAPACAATTGGQVGYDQRGWFLRTIPQQVPHCEAKKEARQRSIQ